MIGKHANSAIRPYALGLTPQSSVYGATIPVIYGLTRGAVYPIWVQNLRKSSGSSKVIKQKKGHPETYAENIDFLIGTNPIAAALQLWQNNNQKLALEYTSYSVTPAGGAGAVTISDARFYFLIGVTLTKAYDVTFNDYGGQGSEHLTGNYEVPLWNTAYAGPDRINISGWRWYPYVYRWTPAFGTGSGTTIDIDVHAKTSLLDGVWTFYYARALVGIENPLAALNLAFEDRLGNGAEYSGYSSEQVIYSAYAGMGSEALDLGPTQMVPNIIPEILGAFPLYSTGDADFPDMVEDIFKGVAQSVHGNGPAYAAIHHGLNCYEFPGAIQKKLRTSAAAFASVVMDLPLTQNSTLLVAARSSSGSALAIADTQALTWTPVFGTTGYNFWTAPYAGAGAPETITISPTATFPDMQVIEFNGLDTIDTIVAGSGTGTATSLAITTSNLIGQPAYILAMVIVDGSAAIPAVAVPYGWTALMAGTGRTLSMYRIVNSPGTYTFTANFGSSFSYHVILVAMKNATPVRWPKPLGNIIDDPTMQLVRNQCRANGIWGSLLMDAQQPASNVLADLYTAMDAAPVWSGFALKSIPWSEVSNVGNGAAYIAPTASGPVANLSTPDFIGSSSSPMIVTERRSQVDSPNLLQIQHPNRASDYNDVTESQPDAASISLFGVRKPQPVQLRCIQDTAIGRMILGIMVRRQTQIRNTYKFKLNAKWLLLEPMDLITLTDDETGMSLLPVRLTSITENENYELECEAEDFFYGTHAPKPVAATGPAPYVPDANYVPGLINAPVLFEPMPGLAGFPTINQLFAIVSNADPAYGGCQVYVSTDGGGSYGLLGTITGNGTTGVLTANWTAGNDPDKNSGHPLSVNLTESLGVLANFTQGQRDSFLYPFYVYGGDGGPVPYELGGYATATLTSAYHYTVTPSSSNVIRRGVYGAPAAATGVTHPSGFRFAFVDPGRTGMLVADLQPNWIGRQLFFKFVAFNQFGGGFQNISDVTAYGFTPTGITKGVTTHANSIFHRFITNPFALSALVILGVITIFWDESKLSTPTGDFRYLGRTFFPGSYGSLAGQTLYMTIADPNYQGDYNPTYEDLATSGATATTVTSAGNGFSAWMVGTYLHIASGTNFVAGDYLISSVPSTGSVVLSSSPTPSGAGASGVGGGQLQAYLDTNQDRIGQPGYMYMGSVWVSDVSSDPAYWVFTPGGWPPPEIHLVNGV